VCSPFLIAHLRLRGLLFVGKAIASFLDVMVRLSFRTSCLSTSPGKRDRSCVRSLRVIKPVEVRYCLSGGEPPAPVVSASYGLVAPGTSAHGPMTASAFCNLALVPVHSRCSFPLLNETAVLNSSSPSGGDARTYHRSHDR
jgi:hypothetical protein